MLIHRLSQSVSVEAVFRRMSREPDFVFLDSSKRSYGLGRYSILCCEPWKRIRFDLGVATIEEGVNVRTERGDPFSILENELPRFDEQSILPFKGGAVGYLAYDIGRYYETLPTNAKREGGGCDMRFNFYDAGICFDLEEGVTYAFASERSGEAESLLNRQIIFLKESSEFDESSEDYEVGQLESSFRREEYVAAVGAVKNRIQKGDVYQVNLSQQFKGAFSGSPESLYQELRNVSQAPYGAYLDFGDEQILSNSPEQLVKSDKGRVVTRPIKGTRPRGSSKEEDEEMIRSLQSSEKDRSELLMIVDLERNDLGRVCQTGSIEVAGLFDIEAYSNVFHQTAIVSGRLKADRTFVDCVKAMFPGGSITGAPKIKAMEVIDELEPLTRGVYTGSIGYFGYDGEGELSVAIRTLQICEGELRFNVGGGIVWDSDADAEYQETLDKGKSIMSAIRRGVKSL